MSKPRKLRALLKDWNEICHRYEKGTISENVFLRVQAKLEHDASFIRPTISEEACAQLLIAILMWKEETGRIILPRHIVMDRIFGQVVDYLGNLKKIGF